MATKNGAKLRKLAEAMTKEVERMTAPPDWTRTNYTRKRGEEATARLKEGTHLASVQWAMYRLADMWDEYRIPHELAYLLTKAQVNAVLRYDKPYRWAMEEAKIATDSEYMATRAALLPIAAVMTSFLEQNEREQAVRRMIGQVPGFYPTPAAVVDQMIGMVPHLSRGDMILEPSAGDGAILRGIQRWMSARGLGRDDLTVHAIEYNDTLRGYVDHQGFTVIGSDFLKEAPILQVQGIRYDVILMNPPFENGQPVTHIRAAYDLLKRFGELVAVVPPSVLTNPATKFIEFQHWLESEVDDVTELALPDDAFRESGTGVRAKLLHLRKG